MAAILSAKLHRSRPLPHYTTATSEQNAAFFSLVTGSFRPARALCADPDRSQKLLGWTAKIGVEDGISDFVRDFRNLHVSALAPIFKKNNERRWA